MDPPVLSRRALERTDTYGHLESKVFAQSSDVVRAHLSLALWAGLAGWTPSGVRAAPPGYTFKAVAFLGDAAPGGGAYINDFEPGSISNRGEVSFVADLTTATTEGVFLVRQGTVSEVLRAGQAAPGGGTFEFGSLGRAALNEEGDLAIVFLLSPFTLPLGANAGVYFYSHTNNTLTALVVPSVTPAPGGGTFQGAGVSANVNNRGEVVFPGVVPTTAGISGTLGIGVFRAAKNGQISIVAAPGDPAPGGGTFDFAQSPWINDGGDVAFGAHVAGETCFDFGIPQTVRIFCAESVYFQKAATGAIQSIAHQGAPAPGGGTYRFAFGPVINSRGDVVFIGGLSPASDTGADLGVFLFSKNSTVSIARPGDPMPGGGALATASLVNNNYSLNNRGEAAFNAALNTGEHALYVANHGALILVAKTGMVIPGVGTIDKLDMLGAPTPSGGVILNDRGQILFGASLVGGGGVMLVATP